MVNVGRFICVALPFILSVASVIALLVASLAGVTDKSLYIFSVNTTDLSVSASSITSLLSDRSLHEREALGDDTLATRTSEDYSAAAASASAAAATATSAADAATAISGVVSGTNITGSDLGLSDIYYVNLWNYCQTISTGGKECRKAQYNWASNATKAFENQLDSVASASNENVTLPDSIKTAMTTFGTVTRWTEIVFIIAFVALAASIVFGFFANCSRAFSCCTFILAAFAAVAVCAAATLATVTAAVVIGAVEGTAKAYGVTGSINTRFLATVWIAAAFAIAAAFFWMFTICCCAPDHNRSRGKSAGFGRTRHLDDAEKPRMTGAGYAPLPEPQNTAYGGSGAYPGNGAYAGHGDYGVNGDYTSHGAYGDSGFGQGATYGNPRTGRNPEMAYEPYSHRA
ncbi:SUR7 family protein pun1 [Cytospora mali]|uniref:SUR7 family protein pun1 n=1 Tax=Cytospora mali TaxID=578113 RepID=A0A194W405_CYTMA|nr:SUR7 family protein pun1 [Valsa mali]